MITSFGKFMRHLRIENGQILKEMADLFEVSSSFLSAVEHGKKSVPDNWIQKITNTYNLTLEESEKLLQAVKDSVNEIKIDLSNKSEYDRDLILEFARKIDNLENNQKQMLKSFLKD